MFSSIGWAEIAVIVLLGIVIIGPERLPGVIMDVRAAIYAARKAINNAKAELQGEMGGLSEEFETLRGPISQAAEWTRLGPRGAITKALFDGDDSAWDDFDPRKLTEGMGKPHLSAGDEQAHSAAQRGASGPRAQHSQRSQQANSGQQGQQRPTFDYSQIYAAPAQPQQSSAQQPQAPTPKSAPKSAPTAANDNAEGTGFSWADVT